MNSCNCSHLTCNCSHLNSCNSLWISFIFSSTAALFCRKASSSDTAALMAMPPSEIMPDLGSRKYLHKRATVNDQDRVNGVNGRSQAAWWIDSMTILPCTGGRGAAWRLGGFPWGVGARDPTLNPAGLTLFRSACMWAPPLVRWRARPGSVPASASLWPLISPPW